MFKTDEAKLVAEFEGCVLEAYYCPAGVLTIGYGHTGPDVYPGMVISSEEAVALLDTDLNKFRQAVVRLVDVSLTENQFAALVSLTYNIGIGAFQKSTLLRKLNTGDYEGAANEFKRWNKGGGQVLRGLVRRRAAEEALFRTPLD